MKLRFVSFWMVKGGEGGVPWGKTVFVHAFVAAVRTGPEPAVFTVFDGVDEEFADFVGGSFGVTVFA